MYEDFYQLTTNPFRLAPDPDFCFSHSGYQSAREYLEYALDQGEGFVMVTGRPGTGKTLLLETFLKAVDVSKVVAKRIAVSDYGSEELLRAVAYAYEIDVAEVDKATLRHRIQQYFLQHEQAGRRVLLIMDEAQALRHSALEELRILADLQTQSRQMLQLFLVGQDSLQELMSTPGMEQFQQRVIANYHLVPLSLQETRAYIEHRLLHAGWNGDPEFTSAAVLSIYLLSKGVPRHINKVCNRLLLLGYGKGSYIFDKQDVQAISTEMHEEQLTPMEASRTLLPDTDSLNSIPEIRDGVISVADLAIRVDMVDPDALAIAEASRLDTAQKAQFIKRHHDDPATWYSHDSSPATPLADTAAESTEQLSTCNTPAPDNQHHASGVIEQFSGYLRRSGGAWVVTATMLAIATVSIAALLSLFDDTAVKDTLSHADHSSTVTQYTNANALQAAAGDDVQALTREIPENEVLVATAGVPGPGVNTDYAPVSDDNDRISNDTVSVQQPPVEQLLPVDDMNERLSLRQGQNAMLVATAQAAPVTAIPAQDTIVTGDTVAADLAKKTPLARHDYSILAHEQNAMADFQPAGGYINRNASPQQLPAISGSVEVASAAAMDAVTDRRQHEEIMELLTLGQQAISDYRLLTPEQDNAYSYFSAVLRLDPGNETAQAGMQEIVGVYIALTRKSLDRRDYNKARQYLDRGLTIEPGNDQLQALNDSVASNMKRASNSTAPVVSRTSQASVNAKERATRDSLMSRITTFFKKRKAEAESGIVIVPAGWDS